MKKYIIVFFASIAANSLISQVIRNEKYLNDDRTIEIKIDNKVKKAISLCFNENSCKEKVASLIQNHYMFKDLSTSKKNRLINSCSYGPESEHEEFFCKIALSICGIENPNNCIAEKMK